MEFALTPTSMEYNPRRSGPAADTEDLVSRFVDHFSSGDLQVDGWRACRGSPTEKDGDLSY